MDIFLLCLAGSGRKTSNGTRLVAGTLMLIQLPILRNFFFLFCLKAQTAYKYLKRKKVVFLIFFMDIFFLLSLYWSWRLQLLVDWLLNKVLQGKNVFAQSKIKAKNFKMNSTKNPFALQVQSSLRAFDKTQHLNMYSFQTFLLRAFFVVFFNKWKSWESKKKRRRKKKRNW